jgi:hypothetical protein
VGEGKSETMTPKIVFTDEAERFDIVLPVLKYGEKTLTPEYVQVSSDGDILLMVYPIGTPWPTRIDNWRKQFAAQGYDLMFRNRLKGNAIGEKIVMLHLLKAGIVTR